MALDAMPSNALAPNPQTYEDAWMTYDGKWGCHFPESENYIVYVDSFKRMTDYIRKLVEADIKANR